MAKAAGSFVEVTKDDCLYILMKVNGLHRWYGLNLADTEGEAEEETRLPVDFGTMPPGDAAYLISVTIGGFIYVFGYKFNWQGSCSPGGKGFVWDQLTPMLSPCRRNPSVFAAAGKIYVFGGLKTGDTGPYAEVYDPESARWEALPDPPEEFRGYVFLHAVIADPNDCNKQRVLIRFIKSKGLYAFDLDDLSWSCVDPNFGDKWRGPAAVVGHLLLCLEPGTHGVDIFGYDLRNYKWLPDPVWTPRGHEFETFVGKRTLIDLGNGKVCYVWQALVGPLLEDIEGHGEIELEWMVQCKKFSFQITDQGEAMVKMGNPINYFFRRLGLVHCIAL